MGTFGTRSSDYEDRKFGEGTDFLFLRKSLYDQFDSSVLGIGDVTTPTEGVEAICAIFDLEGLSTVTISDGAAPLF